ELSLLPRPADPAPTRDLKSIVLCLVDLFSAGRVASVSVAFDLIASKETSSDLSQVNPDFGTSKAWSEDVRRRLLFKMSPLSGPGPSRVLFCLDVQWSRGLGDIESVSPPSVAKSS